jgi:hypothetical protein
MVALVFLKMFIFSSISTDSQHSHLEVKIKKSKFKSTLSVNRFRARERVSASQQCAIAKFPLEEWIH